MMVPAAPIIANQMPRLKKRDPGLNIQKEDTARKNKMTPKITINQ